jgi:NAD(P)H-flavin reductase
MLACGSGLAPIAAAIESGTLGLKDTGYNSLSARLGRLYVGAKTEAHLPLKDRYEAWGELGLEIIPVLSQAPDSPYRKGYVQDALKEDGVGVPRNTGVLMCGHRGMTEDAKEILLSAGVFEGRILLNF